MNEDREWLELSLEYLIVFVEKGIMPPEVRSKVRRFISNVEEYLSEQDRTEQEIADQDKREIEAWLWAVRA